MEENKDQEKVEIYSQRVRAGKRTYFFDIKSTRSNDYYLTITESKRRFKDEGYFYEKHKIFLYKEDFDKFLEALKGTVDHVKTELMPEVDFSQFKDRGEKEDNETSTPTSTNGATTPDDELKWD
ncbi:MAG: PUR family DNA/RNA-binding protein [Cytophagaceae bacterium]|nr:PUR family DNA/RNA-binding protein [Cytophagaceae bacterium]